MKKLITLLLSVCMVVTLTPAISFAHVSGGQQDTEQTVSVESEGEAGQQAVDLQEALPEENAAGDEEAPGGVEPQENEKAVEQDDGWYQAPGGWQYWINGAAATGWNLIGNSWYHFGTDTYMQTGQQAIGSVQPNYYFGTNGTDPGAAGSNLGAMQTGLQTIAGKTYFFSTTGSNPGYDNLGKKQVDVVLVPGLGYCYFDTNVSNYGAMRTGWIDAARGRCYFDPANRGIMTVGKKTIGSSTYYFAANGVMQVNCFAAVGGATYYFGANGAMRTGWLTLGSNKYYLGGDGAVRKGWQTISGDRYYFNTANGVMYKGGPVQIGGAKYYFNTSNGKMVKGWQRIHGARYFFNSNGTMRGGGWFTYNGKKYFLESWGAARTGLTMIKGNRYYFQNDGSMKTNGAVKVNGKLYYFLKSGKGYKKKGWFKGSDGAKRYSLGKGRVRTGKKKIRGVWYMFNSNTGVAKKLGDSFDLSIQSKYSRTSWLITVNRAKYEVRVYQGSQNNWTRIKKMTCGIGAPATPTPAGTFTTTSRRQVAAYTLNGTRVRYWYHTQISSGSDKGIHSGLYYVATGQPYDTSLRTQNSQGSVRLSLGNAEWIYYNVPLRTTVYVK